jgi:hypothetical protein
MKEYKVKVYSDKTEWYINGQLHREDGPAVEWSGGYKAWYINGQYHREDGPAIEWSNGYKAWYLNGKRHREDGPAMECSNGDKAWYINDMKLTEDEFNNKTKPSEMTMDEICDALGKTIKVVK